MKTTIKKVDKFFAVIDDEGFEVIVDGFSEGFVEIEIPVTIIREENSTTIVVLIKNQDEFISFIAGCFDKSSNFIEKIFRAYGCSSNTQFIGFKLTIDDFYCLITKDNSSLFKIKEIIINLLNKLVDDTIGQVNREREEYDKRCENLEQILDNIDLDFKSERAEYYYDEAIDKIEEQLTGCGADFVAYVQYLMKTRRINISTAVREAYETFCSVDAPMEDVLEEIKFTCQYALHGDAICEEYLNILASNFSSELEDF